MFKSLSSFTNPWNYLVIFLLFSDRKLVYNSELVIGFYVTFVFFVSLHCAYINAPVAYLSTNFVRFAKNIIKLICVIDYTLYYTLVTQRTSCQRLPRSSNGIMCGVFKADNAWTVRCVCPTLCHGSYVPRGHFYRTH